MWEKASVAQSRSRRACLEALISSPRTPSSISRATNIHLSHISRSLRELADLKLVECVTPKAMKNRIYRITTEGKKVLKVVRELP